VPCHAFAQFRIARLLRTSQATIRSATILAARRCAFNATSCTDVYAPALTNDRASAHALPSGVFLGRRASDQIG
jgi:hypothetical protein